MTNNEAIEYLQNHQEVGNKEQNEAFDIAIRALKDRENLIERAYGHIVGQGTKGVIRPDELQGWRYEE